MQLRVARVCLDCEDVHAAAQCPVCASEAFMYLSRWVPALERRTQARADIPKSTTPLSTSRVLVGAGVLGVAYVVNRWLRTARQKLETAAERRDSGELL